MRKTWSISRRKSLYNFWFVSRSCSRISQIFFFFWCRKVSENRRNIHNFIKTSCEKWSNGVRKKYKKIRKIYSLTLAGMMAYWSVGKSEKCVRHKSESQRRSTRVLKVSTFQQHCVNFPIMRLFTVVNGTLFFHD